jgi:hypothetical protein
MARSQKKRCDVPSFAAVPTQPEPTTNTICVRTRSPRPSGFLSATLCSSTLRSARSNSGVTRRIVGHALRLPMRKWNRQAKRPPYNTRSMLVLDLFGMADELPKGQIYQAAKPHFFSTRSTLSSSRSNGVQSALKNSDPNNENILNFLELRVRNSVVSSVRSTPANRHGSARYCAASIPE